MKRIVCGLVLLTEEAGNLHSCTFASLSVGLVISIS